MHYSIKISFIATLIITSISLYANTYTLTHSVKDSSLNKNTESKLLSNQSLEKNITAYQKRLEEIKDPYKKRKFLLQKAKHYHKEGNFPYSIFLAKKLKITSKQYDDKKSLATANHLIGKGYIEIGDFTKSINHYFKALSIYDSLQLDKEKARCLKDIGLLYWQINENENAREFYEKGLEISLAINDKENIAFIYNNLGMLSYRDGNFQKAMDLFKESLKIKKNIDNKESYANGLNNIGFLYRAKGKIDSSIVYYKKAIELYNEIDNQPGLANTYNNLSLSFLHKKDYRNAQKYLDLSKNISKELNLLDCLKENYLFRFKKNKAQKNYKKALENYITYSNIKDSLINKATETKINKLQAQYQIEQQNKEIQGLKKEKQLKDKKQELFNNILLISGIALLVVFFLIIRSGNIKKKKNKQLESQNQEIKQKNLELEAAHAKLQKRKEEIEKHRNEIREQQNKLKEQFDIIQSKNWEITNSFEYAGHIQAAIIPDQEDLKKYFDDFFVLLRPKDIVSGDFYWYTENKDNIIVAAADCTGHGVAGGLMSMLGISYLNEIVNVKNILAPEKILAELREMIVTALNQKSHDTLTLSGIDISIVSLKSDKSRIEFAGANNPLYMVRNNELKEYQGDKMPIAFYDNMAPFIKKVIKTQKGDQFYLFTDGYTDQFGGEHHKKFKFKPFRKLIVESNNLPMHDQKSKLNKTFESWKGDLEQVDDVLVLGLKI
jgi:serine phosphatase RsbU (regulator of sigma subunit)/Flp pilus assembly protein TadD